MTSSRVLIIEDDPDIRLVLRLKLEAVGCAVVEAHDGAQARSMIAAEEWDAVFLDHMLPDAEGLEILEKIRQQDPELPVIYMTAFSSVSLAVRAMKIGAFDYLTKPFNSLDEVQLVFGKALEVSSLRREVRNIRRKQRESFGFDKIIGTSEKMLHILNTCQTIARSEASSILLTGESGTGKNLIAQAIHYNSRRAHKPIMTITCTALPEQLLESELFGYEKGAFTDARERKRGLFELGNEGTIFLDEIGDLPLGLQAKLLGVLESRKIRRIGGTQDISIDARIIAATNQDLKLSIHEKRFRSDLYYRINVIQLEIPALRERPDDIPALTAFFVANFNRRFNKSVRGLDHEALAAMQAHDWPGNIRELRNLIERAMILGQKNTLTLSDFPAELRGAVVTPQTNGFCLPEQGVDLGALEKDLIRQAMNRTEGNQTHAARLLSLTRDQLRYRLKSGSSS